MSKKKLFSDRRWTEPPAVVVLGKIKSTKEDKIMGMKNFILILYCTVVLGCRMQ